MKHLRKITALIAVIALATAAVAWAYPLNNYVLRNYTQRDLGTITVEYLNAPPQYINVSTTGNYAFDNEGTLSAMICNGTRILASQNGSVTLSSGAVIQVTWNSGGGSYTTGWDYNEGQ